MTILDSYSCLQEPSQLSHHQVNIFIRRLTHCKIVMHVNWTAQQIGNGTWEANCTLLPSANNFTGLPLWQDIAMCTSASVCLSFGNALLIGILHYERFGGDPQKRGLGNRLIFHAVLAQMAFSTLLNSNMVLARFRLGNVVLYETVTKLHIVFKMASVYFLIWYVALRYFQVVIWGCIKEINEELAISTICRMTYIVSGLLVWTCDLDPVYYVGMIDFQEGKPDLEFIHNLCTNPFPVLPVGRIVPMTLAFSILPTCFAMVHIQMTKEPIDPDNRVSLRQINQRRYNPSMASCKSVALMLYFGLGISFMNYLGHHRDVHSKF